MYGHGWFNEDVTCMYIHTSSCFSSTRVTPVANVHASLNSKKKEGKKLISVRWYVYGNIADKLQPRNINVSFNNNSNAAIDLIVFIFYSDQLVIDVETGIVTK